MSKININTLIKKDTMLDVITKDGLTLINIGGTMILRVKDLDVLTQSSINKIKKYNTKKEDVERSNAICKIFEDTIESLESTIFEDTDMLKKVNGNLVNIYKTLDTYKYINSKFTKVYENLEWYTLKTTNSSLTPIYIENTKLNLEIIIMPMRVDSGRFIVEDTKPTSDLFKSKKEPLPNHAVPF